MPVNERKQSACVLIGAGGTGNTTVILELLLPTCLKSYSAQDGEYRYAILTSSHAQGDAISDETFRAQTAHAVVGYRVASLNNNNMAVATKRKHCERIWNANSLVVQDEISLCPVMVDNMLLYRAMQSRQNEHQLRPESYGEVGQLMGHVPILLVAGGFLQIKPAKEISIADDLDALRQAGKAVHPEHHTAQDATLGIADVIHLTKSKRSLDEAMPALMQALRTSRPGAPLAEAELQKLRRIKIENCQKEHQTPLLADGHVVSIYWETYPGASSKRHTAMPNSWMCHCVAYKQLIRGLHTKTKKHDDIVTQRVLTVPNVYNTGKLPGIVLVHIGMIVRLSDVMAPRLGLVKDKLGKVLSVVRHEHGQMRLNDLPTGYHLCVPKFMAKSIWVQLQNYKRSPLSAHTMPDAEHERRGEETTEDKAALWVADSAVCVVLHNTPFKCDVKIHCTDETVEVRRWQFPLIHGMRRTAYAAQGLTLDGGVVVDLRRAGSLDDDDWWLALYVMLSRARQLTHLILVGFTEQVEKYAQGPADPFEFGHGDAGATCAEHIGTLC